MLLNKSDTIVTLSGGIDSTYVTWDYLRNNLDKTLYIHHCNLKSKGNRWEYEKKAVDGILRWFKSKGYTNYQYTESTFDYGSIGFIAYDIEVLGIFIGVILRKLKLKNVLICASKDDYGQATYAKRAASRCSIVNSMLETPPNYMYPIKEKTREEMIMELPKDLLKLCWYCRTPTKSGKACGKCSTCKNTTKYL
jgi:7-cyano-7-deazaguanine synthase in queuosine biosynthesis